MLSKIRSLAGDTAVYGVSAIAARFLTFLLTPFYTNYLTKTELGDVTYIFAIIAFVNVIYSFGMEAAFMRFFKKDDSESSQKAFTHAFIAIVSVSALFSIILLSISNIVAPSLTDLPDGINLIRMASVIPFLDAVMIIPFALLRMTRRAKRFAATRFVLIAISVALNLVFVMALELGAYGVFLAQLIASFIGACIFLKEIASMIVKRIDLTLLKGMLRFGLPTIPANLSAIILQVADRPILKAFVGADELAEYSVGHRLGIPMMLMVSVFEYAWKPFYLGNFNEPDAKRLYARILTYFTMLCAIVFLAASLFMDYLMHVPFIGGKFINPAYKAGFAVIPLILAGYYFNGVFTNLAAGFHITKKTGYLPLAVGFAAVVNLLLNISLIPQIGYIGAGYAVFGAYLAGAVLLYVFMRRVYPIEYEWRRLAIIIASTVAIYSAGLIADSFFSGWLELLAKIALVGFFAILLWLFGFLTKGETERIKKLFGRKNGGE